MAYQRKYGPFSNRRNLLAALAGESRQSPFALLFCCPDPGKAALRAFADSLSTPDVRKTGRRYQDIDTTPLNEEVLRNMFKTSLGKEVFQAMYKTKVLDEVLRRFNYELSNLNDPVHTHSG